MFCSTRKWISTVLVAGFALTGYSLTTLPATAEEIVSSIARGGLLYDKWYAVIGEEAPTETHDAWPDSNTNKSGATTQRCKSCHGWDLMGVDGAYSSGSYLTGITGLTGMANAPVEDIIAIIQDDTHGFAGMMDEQDYLDLARFVSLGQFDIDAVIDRATGLSNGDVAQGEIYYNTVCAGCHAFDGSEPDDLPATLGALANKNPWEIIQKVLNGQPDEEMPAMRGFDLAVSNDLLAYMQTMPLE